MSSEQQLDKRLQLCAEFVRRGAIPADIGTDHAYLPVWLCRSDICPSAIAADINPEPLSRGKQTVQSAGMSDKIELRLSDGLKEIKEDEADDIIIAGMGGETIAKIIDDCPYAKSKDKRFILQPMTRSEVLIEYLCENGFSIIGQDCCVSSNKCYTVMCVSFTGDIKNTDELFYYTGILTPENEIHRRFLQGHIGRLRKKAKGDARFDALADRLEEYCGDR